jgi:hypothetical protein
MGLKGAAARPTCGRPTFSEASASRQGEARMYHCRQPRQKLFSSRCASTPAGKNPLAVAGHDGNPRAAPSSLLRWRAMGTPDTHGWSHVSRLGDPTDTPGTAACCQMLLCEGVTMLPGLKASRLSQSGRRRSGASSPTHRTRMGGAMFQRLEIQQTQRERQPVVICSCARVRC